MQGEFTRLSNAEEVREMQRHLGVSEPWLCSVYGVLHTDKLTIYILNIAIVHHAPIYLLVDYNGHRYGLYGNNISKIPNLYAEDNSTFWEIRRIDTLYVENDELKKLLSLVCAATYHIDIFPDIMVTISARDWEKILIIKTEESAYGIHLF